MYLVNILQDRDNSYTCIFGFCLFFGVMKISQSSIILPLLKIQHKYSKTYSFNIYLKLAVNISFKCYVYCWNNYAFDLMSCFVCEYK